MMLTIDELFAKDGVELQPDTVYYRCVDGDTTIQLERNELKEGRWVPREEIEGQLDDFSLTHEMMMTFKAGREPKA